MLRVIPSLSFVHWSLQVYCLKAGQVSHFSFTSAGLFIPVKGILATRDTALGSLDRYLATYALAFIVPYNQEAFVTFIKPYVADKVISTKTKCLGPVLVTMGCAIIGYFTSTFSVFRDILNP